MTTGITDSTLSSSLWLSGLTQSQIGPALVKSRDSRAGQPKCRGRFWSSGRSHPPERVHPINTPRRVRTLCGVIWIAVCQISPCHSSLAKCEKLEKNAFLAAKEEFYYQTCNCNARAFFRVECFLPEPGANSEFAQHPATKRGADSTNDSG